MQASSRGPIIRPQRQDSWVSHGSLPLRLGPYGIYVNAITPGVFISGPRVEKMWLARTEEDRQEMLSKIPLRRLGTAEEIANVIVFLASDESGYITGTTIDVNGGRFMS